MTSSTTKAAWEALALRPLRGFVPLGPDPDSKLEEFACVGTGSVPTRDAEGRLLIERDTALVLVLIPGGRDLVGGQIQDPEGPNYITSPTGRFHCVEEVVVPPFFLSQYE